METSTLEGIVEKVFAGQELSRKIKAIIDAAADLYAFDNQQINDHTSLESFARSLIPFHRLTVSRKALSALNRDKTAENHQARQLFTSVIKAMEKETEALGINQLLSKIKNDVARMTYHKENPNCHKMRAQVTV